MTSHPGLFAAASTTSAIGRDSGSSPVQVSRTRRLPMTVPWSGSTRGVLASLRVGATRRRNPPAHKLCASWRRQLVAVPLNCRASTGTPMQVDD